MPNLSLVICTRNRAFALERCLAAVAAADIRQADAECVIVDNGSTDATAQQLAAFVAMADFPVQVAVEPTAGLSRARNVGIAAARGEIIAFTDDDCYIAGDFFAAATAAFAHGAFSWCGGRTLLFDPADARYGYYDAERPKRLPARRFLPAGTIQGCNMLFRRAVFERVGGFDIRLGAGTPFRCEDIEFASRASLAGLAGAYVPEILVFHHHGRKPGSEIAALKRDNDYARGAYYAKRIREGHLSYLRGWLRTTRRSRGENDWRVELRGAWDYWRTS